jgi:hypothetical protein
MEGIMKIKVTIIFSILLSLTLIVSFAALAKTKPPKEPTPPFEDKWKGTDIADDSNIFLDFTKYPNIKNENCPNEQSDPELICLEYKDGVASLLCPDTWGPGGAWAYGYVEDNRFTPVEMQWFCKDPPHDYPGGAYGYYIDYDPLSDIMIDSDGVEYKR